MPWTGSAQQGPWAVASWKAYDIVEEKACGVRVCWAVEVVSGVSSGLGEAESRRLVEGVSKYKGVGRKIIHTLSHIFHLWSHQRGYWGQYDGGQMQ